MVWIVFNHHLRRTAFSRPMISHQCSLINSIKHSNAHSSISCSRYPRPTSYMPSSYSHNNTVLDYGRLENLSFNSSRIQRNYSVLDRKINNRTNSNLSSPEQSSAYFSNLLTSQYNHHDHGTKLFLPSQFTGSLNILRQGHHLSQKQRLPVPTHKSQEFLSNVLHIPGKSQQSRAINVPKLILDASPSPWQPYLQLIRFDKPIGTWLLYWPCTWSIALAAQPGCLPDFYLIALFGAGAFFMRGAGCIVNDMWDKDFDIKVERTKERPLACDKVTYPQALAFLASQLGISLAILLQLNWYSICLGVASMSLVITYPTFKRFTYWPQIVLGLAFNYGALLGWAAVRGSCDWSICLPLYLMCHMWTMIYDTIYAHQDKSDDVLVGVKSTALRFGDDTKIWLSGFTAVMASGLFYVGHITDMTWPYYTGASITVVSILAQLYRLDIDNPEACGDAFRFHFYIGLLMFVSIMFGNLAKPKEEEDKRTSV